MGNKITFKDRYVTSKTDNVNEFEVSTFIVKDDFIEIMGLGYFGADKTPYKNFGYADCPEKNGEESTYTITITWTDTQDSKGSETGVVHKTVSVLTVDDRGCVTQIDRKSDEILSKTSGIGDFGFGSWRLIPDDIEKTLDSSIKLIKEKLSKK